MVETLIEFDFEDVFMTSPLYLFHMKSSTMKNKSNPTNQNIKP